MAWTSQSGGTKSSMNRRTWYVLVRLLLPMWSMAMRPSLILVLVSPRVFTILTMVPVTVLAGNALMTNALTVTHAMNRRGKDLQERTEHIAWIRMACTRTIGRTTRSAKISRPASARRLGFGASAPSMSTDATSYAFLCTVCAYICAVWACCLNCACYIFILDCNRAPHHREVHQCNRCLGQHSPLECTKPLPEGPPRNVDSGGRGGGGRGGRGGRGRNYKR